MSKGSPSVTGESSESELSKWRRRKSFSQSRREIFRRRVGVVNGEASIAPTSNLSIHEMILALSVRHITGAEQKGRCPVSINQNRYR